MWDDERPRLSKGCLCGEPTASQDERLCPRCRSLLPHVVDDLSDEEKASIALAWSADVDIAAVLTREAKAQMPAAMRRSLGKVGLRGLKALYSDIACADISVRQEAGETLASIAKSLDIDDSTLRMRMREWRKRTGARPVRKKSRPKK
jgi:hypothetical protein